MKVIIFVFWRTTDVSKHTYTVVSLAVRVFTRLQLNTAGTVAVANVIIFIQRYLSLPLMMNKSGLKSVWWLLGEYGVSFERNALVLEPLIILGTLKCHVFILLQP